MVAFLPSSCSHGFVNEWRMLDRGQDQVIMPIDEIEFAAGCGSAGPLRRLAGSADQCGT
jgi:hypothetical protein